MSHFIFYGRDILLCNDNDFADTETELQKTIVGNHYVLFFQNIKK